MSETNITTRMSLDKSIREMIEEHEKAISQHYAEIKRILHTPNSARCIKCGDYHDADDNYYGYCSEACANGWAD